MERKDPQSFNVIVTNNMFGDIVTDLGAALQSGLGVAASDRKLFAVGLESAPV